jgi:hypothetical protein
VTATSADEFTPAAVTVLSGEAVTWNNRGMLHNVHFDDGSFTEPAAPSSSPWSVSRTFTATGTFRYYCEAHGGPNGSGMSGAVTVQGAGTTPPAGPGAGAGPGSVYPAPQPVSADRRAPAVRLAGALRQRVLRQRSVRVRAEVDEASRVVAQGTIAVPGTSRVIRLRRASRQLAAGARKRLRLGLTRPALKTLRRAFAKRSRLTARVTVTATDTAGNRRSSNRRVRLTR